MNTLFRDIQKNHQNFLYSSEKERKGWLWRYFDDNYLRIFKPLRRDIGILDIGCSTGHLLGWLESRGFTHLTGVDLCADSIVIAKILYPNVTFHSGDGFSYLQPKTWDFVTTRCVIPHLPKSEILNFVAQIAASLTPTGKTLIEVGNMDWLFAAHERYMDFTHDVGFTKESLGQIMRSCFRAVTILPSIDDGSKTLRRRLFRFLAAFVLRALDEHGYTNTLFNRGLIAVGSMSFSKGKS